MFGAGHSKGDKEAIAKVGNRGRVELNILILPSDLSGKLHQPEISGKIKGINYSSQSEQWKHEKGTNVIQKRSR
jgi:hypothetical protein